MASLPYMQLYVADYLADTYHLTTEEHGAYFLMLMNYWQTAKPLKYERIPSVIRMDKKRFADIEDNLSEFFIIEDGLWIHERIETDLVSVLDKSKKASESAKKRWEKKATNANADTNAKQTQCHKDKIREDKIRQDNTSKEVAEIYPSWLNISSWTEWELHRKELKKKLTPSTKEKQLKFLEKHQNDHIEIINTSIQNGWTGLFKLKVNKGISNLANNIATANEWLGQEEELNNALAIGR